MILKTHITKEAIERMRDATGYDTPAALQALQDVLNLCEFTEDSGRERELSGSIWDGYSALVENGVNPALYKTLGEAIGALGKKPGIRLRRAARVLINKASGYKREAIPADVLEAIETLRESLKETGKDLSQAPETRLRRAEDIIRRFATLRLPDKAIAYPTRSMIDEAIEFLTEGEGRPSE